MAVILIYQQQVAEKEGTIKWKLYLQCHPSHGKTAEFGVRGEIYLL